MRIISADDNRANNSNGANLVFITPESYAYHIKEQMPSRRGNLLFVSCNSGSYMERQTRAEYNKLLEENDVIFDVPFMEKVTQPFASREICPQLSMNVRGADAYVFAALENPTKEQTIHDNLFELLAVTRALKENQASRITAVVPYYIYARQEKPTKFRREPITAKLVADLLETAGINDLITWELHTDSIKGFFSDANVTALNAFRFFLDRYEEYRGRDDTILFAVDAGGVKIIEKYSKPGALDMPYAIASKVRPSKNEATVVGVIGNFKGVKRAIIIDDIIDTAGSVSAGISELRSKGVEEIYIGASHTLLNSPALERLDKAFSEQGLREVYTTNSIPKIQEVRDRPYYKEGSLAPSLAITINRMHYESSVSEVFFPSKTGKAQKDG